MKNALINFIAWILKKLRQKELWTFLTLKLIQYSREFMQKKFKELRFPGTKGGYMWAI
jgi:hypothetical protein